MAGGRKKWGRGETVQEEEGGGEFGLWFLGFKT